MRLPSLRSLLSATAAALPLAAASVPAAAAVSGPAAIGNSLAVTFYLPLRNPAAAEAAAQALQTPASPSYHKFLTLAQFLATYAPTKAQLASAEASLTQMGYTVSTVFPNRLAIEAVAPVTVLESTLGVNIRHQSANGISGLKPDRAPTIPASLRGIVSGVSGLNTLDRPRSHLVHALTATAAARARPGATTLFPTGPGDFLPADFERNYDVTPLYAQGATGTGKTIGIVTLADFYPADAYNFWQQIGLKVSPTRITEVSVDNGEGVPSEAAGEGETDIDVEQSGAIAPGANVRVYVSPNLTLANFIDGFEAAASDNIADTVSTSWGQAELDLFVGETVQEAGSELQDFHTVFLEMALQGQTIFVASGDSGAFDTVEECPVTGSTPTATTPICNAPYAVDNPSDDPLVTAAGGTTLPLNETITLTSNGAMLALSVPTERAWGWDYLSQEAAAQGQAAALPQSAVFSTGDGGGVSSYWAVPWYQASAANLQTTMPGQYFSKDTGSGPSIQVVLPANFAGRNMPDVVADADPETGYQFISEGQVVDGYGGTSFVAPQLNGITALFTQMLGARVGQVNPAIYGLGNQAFPDVAAGDNWGYNALAGYDQATGVGKLDAEKLLQAVEQSGVL